MIKQQREGKKGNGVDYSGGHLTTSLTQKRKEIENGRFRVVYKSKVTLDTWLW